MVSEWYCFFDTIAKVFANCTQKNFNILTSLVQNIGFAIAYNQRIDIGKILWGIIMYRIKCAKRSFDKRTQILCYYPRFLTLIFNHLVSSEHQRAFANNEFTVSMTTHKKFFTRLDTQHRPSRPVVITPFMANFIDDLPTIPAPVPESQTQVDQSTPAGTSAQTSDQVLSPIQVAPPTISHSQPQVGIRADQEVVEPQLPTQVIEPNTESFIPLTSQPLLKLPYRRDRNFCLIQ